jgi:hypothetical protein
MLMRAWSAAPGAEVKGDRKGGEGEFHTLPRTAGNSPPLLPPFPPFSGTLAENGDESFFFTARSPRDSQ